MKRKRMALVGGLAWALAGGCSSNAYDFPIGGDAGDAGDASDAAAVDAGADVPTDQTSTDVGADVVADAGFDVGTPPIDLGTPTPDVPTVDVPSDVPTSPIPGRPVLFSRDASFSTPLTVALSANGSIAYFTAHSPAGVATLFRSAGGGVAPTALPVSGVSLVFPTGLALSADDGHLYIADQAANRFVNGVGAEEGALLTVSVAGGTATALNIGTLRRPRGVAVHGSPEQLTFIAVGANDNVPVVARLAATGGTVTVLATGGVLRDPSALAVSADGTVYVTDARGDSGLGAVFRIAVGGATTRLAAHLRMGLPAGIALSRDEAHLFLAAWNADTTLARHTWMNIDGSGVTAILGASTISPVGIARARAADIFGIADDTARESTDTGWGGVYTAR